MKLQPIVPAADFETDTNYVLHKAGTACNFSAGFQSAIGSVCFMGGPEEKKATLKTIMNRCTKDSVWIFSEEMLKTFCVFKLAADELSCKEHL